MGRKPRDIYVPEVCVRAATGEEMTAFLTVGDVPNSDDFEWPGDPALPAGREIEWQDTQNGEVQVDSACLLWSGEVILNSGSCRSGPFYVHEQAAHAWVFWTALTIPERDIWGMHVVPYACVRRFAPELIKAGDGEFERLNKLWISPLRNWGNVEQFPPPRSEV